MKRVRSRGTDDVPNSIRDLEGLAFDIPGPAGSLKDALDALNSLLRIGSTWCTIEHLLITWHRDRSENRYAEHVP